MAVLAVVCGRDVRVIGLVLLLSMFLAMPSPLASAGKLHSVFDLLSPSPSHLSTVACACPIDCFVFRGRFEVQFPASCEPTLWGELPGIAAFVCSCRRRIDSRPSESGPAKLDFARSFVNATAVGLTKCKSISVKGLDHAFADVSGIVWQEASSDREWFECSSSWRPETERERGQQYVSACRWHFVNRFVLSLFCTCSCVFLDAPMNTPPPRQQCVIWDSSLVS